jgi:Tol biopolymer transport system component
VPLFRQALALTRATHQEEHSEVASAVFDLASALHAAGDHNAGDSLIRYAIGLQRRLVTAALLTGTGDVSTLSSGRAAGETAPVDRALAERSGAATAVPEGVTGNKSRIVFASDRDGPDSRGDQGNSEIYSMNADGSDQRRLTYDKAPDDGPNWSPDGKKIAFHSKRGGGLDVWVMNADGSEPRRVTNFTERGIGAMNPHWSPDGRRILFRSRVKMVEIYVINLDGTGLTRLTDDPGEEATPSWSPDGKKIAFSRRENGHLDIHVIDADGRNDIRLTFNNGHHPEWSPDGRRIAFHSDRDGDPEIYVMNADGTNQIRVTKNPGEDGHASWSPDGKRLVFHRRVLGHVQVHVMNADGSGVKRLTDLSAVAFSGFPNWGPAQK